MKLIDIHDNRLYFKRYSSESFPCMLSIGMYKDGLQNNCMKCKELYNVAILYMCSELYKQNHNIVILPIMFFDIYYKDLKKNNLIKDEILRLHSKDNINDNDCFNILITENYFESETLDNYLNTNINNITEKEIKILIFKVLYSLSILNINFRNFKHNNLDLKSIIIIKKKY